MIRRFLPLALAATASAAGAQSILDIGARVAPQIHSYKIDAPSNTTISEFSVPLFVVVPVSPRLSFDVGSSWTRADVKTTGSTAATSTISGPTDTQIRGNLVLGNDFVVITGGVNLPTGKSTVPVDQVSAASLIGSDFLAFPISNMGSGFGGTGGIAVAYPVGAWNVGGGVSFRHSAQYDPFDITGAPALHYQPGNEYRARIGVDRPVGTGHFLVGLTYSTFGDDNLGGSIYNTGNRYLSQLDYSDTFGPGRLSIDGWNLFRTRGTLAGGSIIDRENIGSGALAYGIPVGDGLLIEPNVEGRTWYQAGAATSFLGTFGLRMQFDMGGLTVVPSGGYSLGQLAAESATTGGTTATLTGYHATLAIRLR